MTLSLYGCGVTVYDHCHIGHGRVFVLYDTLVRFLQASGYKVQFARNITDIDDKIIKKSQESDEEITELTQRYTRSMHEDIARLNCLDLTDEPKATESIEVMLQMIASLIEKNHAYVLESGEVLFSIESFSRYGALSGQSLDQLHHGSRVATAEGKRSPGDFTLWKPSKDGEPAWPSPWCHGRPGWHIECSAMIEKIFQGSIDIHLGGADLKFPHHENEIAQSECCFQRPLADLWMHIGFVQVKEEKMSKSLGNFSTLKEVFEQFDGNTLRVFYLMTHYRQPIGFSHKALEQAENTYQSLQKAFLPLMQEAQEDYRINQEIFSHLLSSLNDDLNTPALFASLFATLKERKSVQNSSDLQVLYTVKVFCETVLGLTFESDLEHQDAPNDIVELAQKRQECREQKLWDLSDSYREQIMQQGWEVLDTAEGFTLKKR